MIDLLSWAPTTVPDLSGPEAISALNTKNRWAIFKYMESMITAPLEGPYSGSMSLRLSRNIDSKQCDRCWQVPGCCGSNIDPIWVHEVLEQLLHGHTVPFNPI